MIRFVRPDESGRHVCAMALRQLSYRAVKLAAMLRGGGEDSGRVENAVGGCCCICLDDVEVEEGGQSGVALQCKHVYHHSCLDLLMSSGHTSCPQCRDDVAGVGSLEAVLGTVLQVLPPRAVSG
jgi:hypothetical protein